LTIGPGERVQKPGYRKTLNWSVIVAGLAAAGAFAAPAHAQGSASITVTQAQAQIMDYCATENLSAGACAPGVWWEVKGSCPAPKKVAAVSCALDDLNGDPRLISNAVGTNRTTGSCVWGFTNLKQSDAPTGTITLLCTTQ